MSSACLCRSLMLVKLRLRAWLELCEKLLNLVLSWSADCCLYDCSESISAFWWLFIILSAATTLLVNCEGTRWFWVWEREVWIVFNFCSKLWFARQSHKQVIKNTTMMTVDCTASSQRWLDIISSGRMFTLSVRLCSSLASDASSLCSSRRIPTSLLVWVCVCVCVCVYTKYSYTSRD